MKAQMVTDSAGLAPAEWQYYREIGRTHRTNLGCKSMEICWPISWSLEAVGLFKVVVSCSSCPVKRKERRLTMATRGN